MNRSPFPVYRSLLGPAVTALWVVPDGNQNTSAGYQIVRRK
jgi:hypothetical protein